MESYDTATVTEYFELWPYVEAAMDRGEVRLVPRDNKHNKEFERKVAREQMGNPITDVVDINADIQTAMQRCLSPKERARLTGKYFYQMSYEEIANNIGMSEAAVRHSCNRAIQKIADYLESDKESMLPPYQRPEQEHRRKYRSSFMP